MPSSGTRLSVESIADTPRDAIRLLLTEFRHRGWRDRNSAALQMVRCLQREGGATVKQVAGAAPGDFIAANNLRRADVELLMKELASRHS